MKEITATMTKGWQNTRRKLDVDEEEEEGRRVRGNTRRRVGGVPEREDSEVGNKR